MHTSIASCIFVIASRSTRIQIAVKPIHSGRHNVLQGNSAITIIPPSRALSKVRTTPTRRLNMFTILYYAAINGSYLRRRISNAPRPNTTMVAGSGTEEIAKARSRPPPIRTQLLFESFWYPSPLAYVLTPLPS